MELLLPEDGILPVDALQPIPDSRKIEDLIGSGEFESKRSRKGDLRDAILGAEMVLGNGGYNCVVLTVAERVRQGLGNVKEKVKGMEMSTSGSQQTITRGSFPCADFNASVT